MTDCRCEQPGWCERHQCQKTVHWHKLCRTRAEYFRLWEQGLGPGQSNDRLEIAPLRGCVSRERPWEGSVRKKPWRYQVTAAIPVLDTFDTLEMVIEILRLQTERPFIVVIDTGSRPEMLEKIEGLRDVDLEVHSLRLNGVEHPSDFPAMAMDVAFTVCRSPYLFATHADCFLRRRTLVAAMLDLCRDGSPVVGYELSPRKHKDWQGMVGHTCTMLDMAVMDEIGAGWSMRRLARQFGLRDHRPDPNRPNWPDTELLLNYTLRSHGITPRLIGHEENHVRNCDENIDHCRSLTAGLLYNETYYDKARGWADEAMSEARARVELWKSEKAPPLVETAKGGSATAIPAASAVHSGNKRERNPWGSRCWLLTSPRSGSTYLQYLLNVNAGVPIRPADDRQQARYSFGEHLSEQLCGSWEDLEEWDPIVSKVHCHQYGHYLLSREAVKERFPGIRFVLLERRDSCAQAVSLALANHTGVTQCTSERQLSEFRDLDPVLTDSELLDCHRAVLDYLAFWRNWLHTEQHLTVTYEALVESPREIVAEILDFLKTPYREISAAVPLRKLFHPRSAAFTERLRSLVQTESHVEELTDDAAAVAIQGIEAVPTT